MEIIIVLSIFLGALMLGFGIERVVARIEGQTLVLKDILDRLELKDAVPECDDYSHVYDEKVELTKQECQTVGKVLDFIAYESVMQDKEVEKKYCELYMKIQDKFGI